MKLKRHIREISKGIVLGILVFAILVVIGHFSGNKISVDRQFWMRFAFTMLYSITLYYANALTFMFLDKIYEKDRFQKRRLFVGFFLSFAITLFVIFLLRIFEEIGLDNKTWTQFVSQEKPAYYTVAVIIFFFVSLFVHAFYFYKSYQDSQVNQQKIIAGTASAKFESLKNQIDPHFLFNSLNVLSSLIEENPDNAQKFTTSLSKVYRYVLEQKDKELISVAEELSFAETYMNLLKMRFENSLFYELPKNIPNPEAKVVPLSLQLLLENTVKHNVVSEQRPLRIKIEIDGDYLSIQNVLQKKEVFQDRQGVGLQNIINRYAIITNRKVMVEETKNAYIVKIPILTKQVSFMQSTDKIEDVSLAKIQKQVEEIKGFYGNLISYIVVITGLAIMNLITTPQYLWFLYPAGGWGIGVLIHWMKVFNRVPFFGKDWEERKIQELLDKEHSDRWN